MTEPLFNQVVQIGIVVKDAAATVQRYEELLGLSGWHYNEVDTTRGKDSNFTQRGKAIELKALIAWLPLGNVEIELIEPRNDEGLYAKFLIEHGPGVHHIMLATPDYDHCLDRVKMAGIDLLGSGTLQNTRFALLNTQADLGLICEIAQGGPLTPDY